MLTLDPDSSCDICAESYGHGFLPHSIPCGHVFCAKCLGTICEKNPRNPCCPFCRESFTDKTLRPIRADISRASATIPPSPIPTLTRRSERNATPFVETDDSEPEKDLKELIPDRIARRRTEAKALEARVAKAAETKSTFEEVSALHKEIQDWINEENRTKTGKHIALRLSSALLRAILLNSMAFTEASKTSKGIETSLREELETSEQMRKKVEAELRRQRQQYSEKVHECQQLQEEVARLRRGVKNPAPGTTRTTPWSATSDFAPSPALSTASSVSSSYSMPPRPPPRYSPYQTPTPISSPAPQYRAAVPPSPSFSKVTPPSSAPASPDQLPSVRPETPTRTDSKLAPARHPASPARSAKQATSPYPMSSAAASLGLGVTSQSKLDMTATLNRSLSADSEKKLQAIQALERSLHQDSKPPQMHERWLPNGDYDSGSEPHKPLQQQSFYKSHTSGGGAAHAFSHSRSNSTSGGPTHSGRGPGRNDWIPPRIHMV